MTLKYTDKVQLNRQREIDAYRNSIVEILESSKQLAACCDNLVKLRALKTRCDKIAKPRVGPGYSEDQKLYRKRRYQENKDTVSKKSQLTREKIKAFGGEKTILNV